MFPETEVSVEVPGGRENCPGLEGEELGARGRELPVDTAVLALLLLELLLDSCFFFELLNFTLPESVSFSFSNNLLIGLSIMTPCVLLLLLKRCLLGKLFLNYGLRKGIKNKRVKLTLTQSPKTENK